MKCKYLQTLWSIELKSWKQQKNSFRMRKWHLYKRLTKFTHVCKKKRQTDKNNNRTLSCLRARRNMPHQKSSNGSYSHSMTYLNNWMFLLTLFLFFLRLFFLLIDEIQDQKKIFRYYEGKNSFHGEKKCYQTAYFLSNVVNWKIHHFVLLMKKAVKGLNRIFFKKKMFF